MRVRFALVPAALVGGLFAACAAGVPDETAAAEEAMVVASTCSIGDLMESSGYRIKTASGTYVCTAVYSCVDDGYGTGYWSFWYAKNCTKVTVKAPGTITTPEPDRDGGLPDEP